MECVNFKSVNKGSFIGSGTITFRARVEGINGVLTFEIPDFMLFQKDGRQWLNMPSREYESNGEKKYYPLVKIQEKEGWQSFVETAKKAVLEYCGNNPHPDDFEAPF